MLSGQTGAGHHHSDRFKLYGAFLKDSHEFALEENREAIRQREQLLEIF